MTMRDYEYTHWEQKIHYGMLVLILFNNKCLNIVQGKIFEGKTLAVFANVHSTANFFQ